MEKITTEKLINCSLSDARLESVQKTEDLRFVFSGAAVNSIVFKNGQITEIRIRGYEVLDEEEEVVFDMPDVEILGDKINDALASLAEYDPHAVEFVMAGENAVLVVNDNTDTYEIEVSFDEILAD